MSEHTLRAECTVRFTPAGMTDHETSYPEVEITFRYVPGYPATGPTYASGGEPGAGAEIDAVSARLVKDDDGLAPTEGQVFEWAKDYLDSDAGYEHACRTAEDEQGPDPDDWYDAKRNGDFDV